MLQPFQPNGGGTSSGGYKQVGRPPAPAPTPAPTPAPAPVRTISSVSSLPQFYVTPSQPPTPAPAPVVPTRGLPARPVSSTNGTGTTPPVTTLPSTNLGAGVGAPGNPALAPAGNYVTQPYPTGTPSGAPASTGYVYGEGGPVFTGAQGAYPVSSTTTFAGLDLQSLLIIAAVVVAVVWFVKEEKKK